MNLCPRKSWYVYMLMRINFNAIFYYDRLRDTDIDLECIKVSITLKHIIVILYVCTHICRKSKEDEDKNSSPLEAKDVHTKEKAYDH